MMMSYSKGYDTHEDIIHVGKLRIHVPCTLVNLTEFYNNYKITHKPTQMLAKLNELI
jgi:hypothetical protein